jgi:hypothetical protein
MAIRVSSVSFPPLRGGGPRTAQATVVFPRTVLRAGAALTHYAVGFSGSDHHVGKLQIALDPVVNADSVTVNVTYGVRDWSGNWDDDYTGDIEFAVIAELVSSTAPPPRTDVVIADAEFNQATQYFQSFRHLDAEHALPDNSIRLIGGKNLGVRVYVDYDVAGTTSPIAALSGEMRITATSGATTTIAPLAAIMPRPQAAIDRGNVGHTLNFMIPGIWCEGQLDMQIEVFDVAQPSPRSTPFARTLRFVDVTPLQVHAIAVHYTGQGLNLPAPSVNDVAGALDFTERIYPVGEVALAGYQTQDYGSDLKPSDDGDDTPGFDGILDMLLDLRGGGDELFVALLPQGGIDTEIDTTGWSIAGIERSGVGVSFIGDGAAVAHEIAHAFGRDHAPCDDDARCDDPKSPDDGYPHYGTYPSDSIGEFGFDPIANKVFDPATTFDFMGYSSIDWVSPYSYTALMSGLPPTSGGPVGNATSHAMLRRRPDSQRQGMGLLLRLTLAADGTVRLEPSFTHEVRRVPLQGCGKWNVVQRNGKNEVLQCVTLRIRDDCESCPRTRRVRQLVSRSAGAETLVIVHDGKDVLVEPFGEPPNVDAQLHSENDQLEVRWTSAEAAGNDIWVLVQGLDPRGVWRGLAARTRQQRIVLPRAQLTKRRYSKLRLLAVRKLATVVVDLPYEPVAVTAAAQIIVRVVAPGVLKAWVVGDDGAEPAQLRWSDEFGAEIGRGHTLDLRHRHSLNVIRVSAVRGQRLIPSRVITLEHTHGALRIAFDGIAGTWRNVPIAAHPGKPIHQH